MEFCPEPESFVLSQDIATKKFCLTKIKGKKIIHHYVAEIIEIDGNELKVKFLKRYKNTFEFIRAKDVIYDIERKDIVLMLPDPESSGCSKRQKTLINFGVDFSSLKFNVE